MKEFIEWLWKNNYYFTVYKDTITVITNQKTLTFEFMKNDVFIKEITNDTGKIFSIKNNLNALKEVLM